MNKKMIVTGTYYGNPESFILKCEDCGLELTVDVSKTEQECPKCYPKMKDPMIAGNTKVYVPYKK